MEIIVLFFNTFTSIFYSKFLEFEKVLFGSVKVGNNLN
jgi:hypothetical protein